MRFLKLGVNHELSLTKDLSTPPAPYAILSHTWGADEEEVTFDGFGIPPGRNKVGYDKLWLCASLAREDGLEYYWVDTCCINKANHSELSEAITSMFRWYQEASKCYVHLVDVSVKRRTGHRTYLEWETAFRRSRWFTRGWTLQELLAPKSVEFFSKEGAFLGNKQTLAGLIHEITSIPIKALKGEALSTFAINERLRWAEKRRTKKIEDQAYCLLGIFEVFMPLMYGEGNHAFTRLKAEIDTKTRKSTIVAERMAKPPAVIPFNRDAEFVGRGTVLDRLQKLCAVPGSRTALVGLGGVGKSQLAIEYLYRIRETSPRTWVFWVHASNAARFEQSYRDIADCVEIPGRTAPGANVLQLVHNWLRDERNGKWMMALDNVDNANFLLEAQSLSQGHRKTSRETRPLVSYLPRSPNGSILVTSRSHEVALKLVEPCNTITVDPMSETDALTLLGRKLGKHNDGDSVIALARALEFMPLAIVQAAAYIRLRAPRCSVKQYLRDFLRSDQKRATLLNFEGGQLRRDFEAKNSIITTLQLSFDQIQRVRPSAADLLSLMSFFDRQGIPETLLRRGYERIGNPAQNQENRPLKCIGVVKGGYTSIDGEGSTNGDDSLEDDINTLCDWALIDVTPNGRSFGMHRLVQVATRAWLRTHGQQERWKQQSIKVLDGDWPYGFFEDWARCQVLYPHVKSVAAQKPTDEKWLLKWASLLNRAARYAQAMQKWFDAEQMSQQSLRARKRLLKADHPDVCSSMHVLAFIYFNQGRLREAEDLDVQVIEFLSKTYGPDHYQTLLTTINLALTYQRQERWHEAEALIMKAIWHFTRLHGPNHPDTLGSRAILGRLHYVQGRLDTAEEIFTHALEMMRREDKVDHPNTLAIMEDLARILKDTHRDQEAIALMEECSRHRKRVLGPDHPLSVETSSTLDRWTREVAETDDAAIRMLPTRTRASRRDSDARVPPSRYRDPSSGQGGPY